MTRRAVVAKSLSVAQVSLSFRRLWKLPREVFEKEVYVFCRTAVDICSHGRVKGIHLELIPIDLLLCVSWTVLMASVLFEVYILLHEPVSCGWLWYMHGVKCYQFSCHG